LGSTQLMECPESERRLSPFTLPISLRHGFLMVRFFSRCTPTPNAM